MLKKIAILLIVLFSYVNCFAENSEDQKIKFMNINWDLSQSELKEKMKNNGFIPIDINKNIFQGKFMNYGSKTYIDYNKDILISIHVFLKTDETDYRECFDKICKLFTTKYGTPWREQREYSDTYQNNKGLEASYIKRGEAEISNFYLDAELNAVTVWITEDLEVATSYHSSSYTKKIMGIQ